MDVREKLIELLLKVQYQGNAVHGFHDKYIQNSELADHIISNGVTVQEWISVDDRLPEAGGYVACIAKRNPFSRFMPMVARIEKNGWVNPITEQYISEVTHWMPIPQPQKGE